MLYNSFLNPASSAMAWIDVVKDLVVLKLEMTSWMLKIYVTTQDSRMKSFPKIRIHYKDAFPNQEYQKQIYFDWLYRINSKN